MDTKQLRSKGLAWKGDGVTPRATRQQKRHLNRLVAKDDRQVARRPLQTPPTRPPKITRAMQRAGDRAMRKAHIARSLKDGLPIMPDMMDTATMAILRGRG